ncbi:MAG TPA: SDR family oxidoreductase [Myxococcales bacterium]|nr:SDR family oxidoreductase [Myxococcales bacterium]HIN86059.1 SDR family oxidoreductase [Myxococcales bacterium]
MSIFNEDLLTNEVAFITGGGSGIGAEIVKTLAAHGAKVAICGRTQEKLDAVAKEVEDAGGECLAMTADVRDPDQLKAVVAAIKERWDKLTILVNSAAGNFLCPAAALSANGFSTVIDIDLKGTFNACKAAFPLLSQNGGNIINISATLQYTGTPMQIHASSAKAGIDALTRTLAVEWGGANIRVNAVAPGPIDNTPGMSKLAPGDVKEKLTQQIPLNRFGSCREIADSVLFLVSSASSYTTGSILVVDGGQWIATAGLGSISAF